MQTYDAIILGSGQGGVPLATNLADQGWSVALIEKADVGGSCINYGCTPTKTIISSARIAHYARVAPEFGIHLGKIKVNMAEVVARKNEIVEKIYCLAATLTQLQLDLTASGNADISLANYSVTTTVLSVVCGVDSLTTFGSRWAGCRITHGGCMSWPRWNDSASRVG